MSRSTLAQIISAPLKESSSAKPDQNKHAGFLSRGQAWFCSTGLPSDVTIEVDEMVFHLHKFPLTSRSGKIASLVAEASCEGEEDEAEDGEDTGNVCRIRLEGMPGGPIAFEQVAQFCYGMKVELTASNVATLRCASEYLHMTEEYGERNLLCLTEHFLNHVILRSWTDSVAALQSCEALLPLAENLFIVKKCVDSIALKACTDPNFTMGRGSLRSPDGTLLWNGISTGARLKNTKMDWWYEDISMLSLPLFKSVIVSMKEKGLKAEMIAGALMYYAKKLLPGLTRRHEGHSKLGGAASPSPINLPCEAEQIFLLETIESLLPSKTGVVSTPFLFGLLKLSIILHASAGCKASLEKRIAMQLEQASLDDILIPNYSYSSETLYDVDCVQRLMHLFARSEKALSVSGMDTLSSPHNKDQTKFIMASPSCATTPLRAVAKLLDAYLGEIAPDTNVKLTKFQALAECLPHYARVLDDGLYRAIDIFIKGHPWMSEEEREMLCNIIDCQKLSLEACTHASQNERLPMRVVVQVLFMEQMQLRAAILGCLNGTTPRNSAATPDVAATEKHLPSTHHELRGMPPAPQLLDRSQNLHHPDILVGGQLSTRTPDTAVGIDILATPKINSSDVLVDGGGRRKLSNTPQLNQYVSLSAHESKALHTDLAGLRSRIGELERECSRLRSRLRRKASSWASLSAKLTCRSISDISDMSGSLHQAPRPRLHAIMQPSPHAPRPARLSYSSCHHLTSSSSTHSLYTPSPKFK